MRMAGQMGNKQRTQGNLEILKVLAERNILIIKGSIPGANNSYVTIYK